MSDPTPDGTDTAPTANAGPVVPMAWGVPVVESGGQTVLHPPVDRWLETVAACRDDGFCMAIDLVAVDYSAPPGRPDIRPSGALDDLTKGASVRPLYNLIRYASSE